MDQIIADQAQTEGLRALLYDAEGRDRVVQLRDVDWGQLDTQRLLWVHGPAAEVSSYEGLPEPLASALRLRECARSFEILGKTLHFCIPYPPGKKSDAKAPIEFIVGDTWLMTLCDHWPDFMARFVENDRGESLKGRLSPSAFAAALLSDHLDTFSKDLFDIDKAIDALDEQILGNKRNASPLARLATLRRRLSTLRYSLSELRGNIHHLTRPDVFEHIPENDRMHFEQLRSTFERLEDGVGRARDTVVGSFELYTTKVAQETNQLLKFLTLVTVVTGIVGALAGIFGMNFDTPFFHSGIAGFLLVTSMMICVCAGLIALSLWRRWF